VRAEAGALSLLCNSEYLFLLEHPPAAFDMDFQVSAGTKKERSPGLPPTRQES